MVRIHTTVSARVSRQCVISLEVVDPKVCLNRVNRKGNWLIFQYREVDFLSGNTNELGDASGTPGKSYLFFLTAFIIKKREWGNSFSFFKSVYPEIRLTGARV